MEIDKMHELYASSNLSGCKIDDWVVGEMIATPQNFTSKGAADYALFYNVSNSEGTECVMKVLDLYGCYMHPLMKGQEHSAIIQEAMRDFRYERNLAEHCKKHNTRRLISYVDSGETYIMDFPNPLVCYIVYEKSEGTVLDVLDFSKKVSQTERIQSIVYKLKLLHDITSGINQLHRIKISHQDLSPAKVLSFGEGFKLGDLSRALCLDSEISCPFPLDNFNGRDYTYAPPEVFFNHKIENERERLYQIDNYMIGSLIVYYITGLSFNVLLQDHLSNSMRDMANSGLTFEESQTYLIAAHAEALQDLKGDLMMDDDIRDGIVDIVRYLCYPIPEKRGHDKVIGKANRTSNADLERTISKLDLLSRRAELALAK